MEYEVGPRTFSPSALAPFVGQSILAAACSVPSAALCGRQSCLQAAFQAAVSALAMHGGQWGRQSCLQPPFRRLANPEHRRSQRFFGFVPCRYRDGKSEKFVRCRASRLKAGCSQD